MISRIAIFIGFISLGIIVLSFQAYALNNTFSVYGTILEDNGTPITGATIKLIEPNYIGNDSYSFNRLAFHSTVTDSQGNFQFVNVTTNYSICEITISYPDHRPDI